MESTRVAKKAAPSILFLVSDGGRNEEEMGLIRQSREIMEEIDWDCKVYKFYFEKNNGLYSVGKHYLDFLWKTVDRCIFLEDDYIPSVSFFRYCAELLEKYKDDERIEMITGNNVFGVYEDAEPYDYFFAQTGWSIWGTATWRRVAQDYVYPFDYKENKYIQRCMKDNLTRFWYKMFIGYCKGQMVDGHVPGSEYYHGINSALHHRVSIIPTRNLVRNCGITGIHFNYSGNPDKIPKYLNIKTYELAFPIKHPKYVVDDKRWGKRYELLLGHRKTFLKKLQILVLRSFHLIKFVLTGRIVAKLKEKIEMRRKRKANIILEK